LKKVNRKVNFLLTRVNKPCIREHINERNAMHSISLEYTDLSSAALIKIFQLADILVVTPKEAAKIYLATKAKQAANQNPNQGRAA
jgi:hypothetical protein